MAIKKSKWKDLLTNLLNSNVVTAWAKVDVAIDDVVTAQSAKFGDSNIGILYNEIKSVLCMDPLNESMWKDLLIYTSSFKENDRRFLVLLAQKALEYTCFYEKILTDSGVQRALIYAKSYGNDGTSSTVERATNSTTPQNSNLYNADEEVADTMFDEAIANFASNIDKNKGASTSHTEGESTTNVSGVTWDEQRKNLQMVYYGELCNYLMSIPEKIYSYYSLDTIPAPELTKLFFKHIKEVMEMFNTYE